MSTPSESTRKNFKPLAIAVTATVLFLWLIDFVLIRKRAFYDYAIVAFLAHHPLNPMIFRSLNAITMLANTETAIALLFLAALLSLRFKGFRRTTMLLTLETGLAALVEVLLKGHFDHIIPPDAPNDPYIAPYGFPSGHAMLSVCFYGLLFHHIYRHSPPSCRPVILLTAGLLALLIGGSRVLLSIHYLSDVLGGYLIAIPLLVLGILFYDREFPERFHPEGMNRSFIPVSFLDIACKSD